jgi:hypothetical protein
MKIAIMAASFLAAALALPIAAEAGPDCGVPQGYGTNNPFTFNRSTCGLGDYSYHVPTGSNLGKGVSETVTKPADIGSNNAFLPNTGAPHLGSNTDGPSNYSYTIPSTYAGSSPVTTGRGADFGTNNPYTPNSGAPHLGSNTDGL